MNQKLSILIADDHQLFVEGLTSLFRDSPAFTVIDTVNSGRELLEVLCKCLPDIILLDINMPGMNGLDALKHIKKNHPSVKVILLSTYNEAHIIKRGKELGMAGYLLKNIDADELTNSIHQVYSGKVVCPTTKDPSQKPLVSDSFLQAFNITPRETEVIAFIKDGYTNQQIANELHLSIYTVETHRKNIMQKLNLKSPAALIKFILEHNPNSRC